MPGNGPTSATVSRREENRVKGPNEAFTSVRPQSGTWTASFGVSNHFANLKGEQIRVYSARQVAFQDYNTASGHAGRSGHIVFKIQLSEPVAERGLADRAARQTRCAPASLTARYSRDGQNWLDAHAYPPGLAGDYAPPPVTLPFDPPTDVLYLGWFADVPSGTGWWLIGINRRTDIHTCSVACGRAARGTAQGGAGSRRPARTPRRPEFVLRHDDARQQRGAHPVA